MKYSAAKYLELSLRKLDLKGNLEKLEHSVCNKYNKYVVILTIGRLSYSSMTWRQVTTFQTVNCNMTQYQPALHPPDSEATLS